MSKSLQQMTQTFSALSNDLLYLVRGNNDLKIRVDDILPNIGVGGYESLTYAQLAAKVTNAELVTGRTYFINDKDIFVKAITKSQLDPLGIWLQRLPDYNNLNGNFIGIWEDTLTPQVGDLVAWNGKMYENTLGVNGTTPPNLDAINWLQLPPTDTRYNIEFAALLYDFAGNKKIRVLDKRGNDICQTAIEEFKFGDDNVKYNKVENGGIFKSLNCFSELSKNYISAAKVDVNLNKAIFEQNRIFGGFDLLNVNELTYTGSSYEEFRGNKIYLKKSYTITGSHVNEVLDKEYSTFKALIDITNAYQIDLNNYKWAGEIILDSSNLTESIRSILNMPSHRVRFKTKYGLQVTFLNGVLGNTNEVLNNRMIGMLPYNRVVNTATDGSFIEYRLSGVNPIEVGYGKYN